MKSNIVGWVVAAALAPVGAWSAYAAPASLSLVKSGDAFIEVRAEGHGPDILMIPSAGRSSHDFDDLAKRLVGVGFHVVLMDPRGTHGSMGLRSDLTLVDYAHDSASTE